MDLPLPGAPAQEIEATPRPRSVAVLGSDAPHVRCSLEVEVGDPVVAGQVLFRDRRRPEIGFVAPAAGRVSVIHRGEARRIAAVEIEVSDTGSIELPRVAPGELRGWTCAQVTRQLLESGDWVALRERPFGRIATPGARPSAIFVRAMDSEPLAADAAAVLGGRADELEAGLTALSRLTDGPLYLCSRPGLLEEPLAVERLEHVEFAGPHPAGLVGTHIHHLRPVSAGRSVWYAGYQDVLAIGRMLRTGRPDPARVVALAGPAVRSPRLLRTLLGASTEDLVRGELAPEACRVLSGSSLSGRLAAGAGAFLGRYHEQICALPERTGKPGRGWWVPGRRGARRVPPWPRAPRWSGELHGAPGGFVPLELLDRACPLRLPLAPLLRALAAGDARTAATFGALQLEEEDLALASFLCPAKLEYGPLLRAALDELAEHAA